METNALEALEIYCAFMESYADFFEEMLETEKIKLEALLSLDLKKIEQTIAVGQANAMKLEGLEKRRMSLQRDAGFSDWSFQQIIDYLKGEPQQPRLQKQLERISRATAEVQYYNKKSMNLVKTNMVALGMEVPEEINDQAYGPNKNNHPDAGFYGKGAFETKI